MPPFTIIPIWACLFTFILSCGMAFWFIFYSGGVIAILVGLSGLILFLIGINQKAIQIKVFTQNFRMYISVFILVFALQNFCFVLAYFDVYRLASCGFIVSSTFSWGLLASHTAYIKDLYPLKPMPFSFMAFWPEIKTYAYSFGLTVCGLVGVYVIVWGVLFLVTTCASLDNALNYIRLILGFVLILGLVIGYFFYIWAIKRLTQKYCEYIGNRKKKFYFFGFGFTKFLSFFRKTANIKKDIFLFYLAGLGSTRYIPPVYPIVALVSFRLDGGISFVALCMVLTFTTFLVSVPLVHQYLVTTYGSKCLRYLGWNTFGIACIKCAARGTIILGGAYGIKKAAGVWMHGIDRAADVADAKIDVVADKKIAEIRGTDVQPSKPLPLKPLSSMPPIGGGKPPSVETLN